MYPQNTASPPEIAVGQIYLLADGSVVTSGANATVTPSGGSETPAAGNLSCLSTSGIWVYTPTQAETNYASFIVSVYKASCTSVSVTVVTDAGVVQTADVGDRVPYAIPFTQLGGTGTYYPQITLQGYLTTAITEGATGRIAASAIKYGDVATPAFTAASVNQTGNPPTVQNMVDGIDTVVPNGRTNAFGARIPDKVAGAAAGLMIAGANAATTFASLTVTTTTTLTGNVSLGGTLGVTGTTIFTGAVSMPAGLAANITGNLLGTVSTLTTYTGNTPQTGDCYPKVGGPPVIYAQGTENYNATGGWNSVAGGGGTAYTNPNSAALIGDLNGKTVTLNQSPTLASIQGSSATDRMLVTSTQTLTANVNCSSSSGTGMIQIGSSGNLTLIGNASTFGAGSTDALQLTANGAVLTVDGNLYAYGAGDAVFVAGSITGTLRVNGNIYVAGSLGGAGIIAGGATAVTVAVYGQVSATGTNSGYGVNTTGTQTLTISNPGGVATVAQNSGTYGVLHNSSGTSSIVGAIIASAGAIGYAQNSGGAVTTITSDVSALTGATGIKQGTGTITYTGNPSSDSTSNAFNITGGTFYWTGPSSIPAGTTCNISVTGATAVLDLTGLQLALGGTLKITCSSSGTLTQSTGTVVKLSSAAQISLTACSLTSTIQQVNTVQVGGTAQTPADVGNLVATVGAAGAGLTGLPAVTLTSAYDAAKSAAQAETALSNVTWTGTLAANLGTVYTVVTNGTYGNSALLTAMLNIEKNTFISSSIPAYLEIPATSSKTITMTFLFADETGAAADLDSGNPTITLVNQDSTDLSGRLGSWTHVGTGQYTIPYTNTSTDAQDLLEWGISGTVNTKLRRYTASTQLASTIISQFTATDRSNLGLVVAKVPAYTPAVDSDGKVTFNNASIGVTGTVTLAANQHVIVDSGTVTAVSNPVALTSAYDAAKTAASATAISNIYAVLSSASYGNAALLTAIQAGGGAPTAEEIAAVILADPSYPLATNSDGSVTAHATLTGDGINSIAEAIQAQPCTLPATPPPGYGAGSIVVQGTTIQVTDS